MIDGEEIEKKDEEMTDLDVCSLSSVPVTLIRHAQSEYNATGIRDPDCNITDFGKQQASHLTGSYDLVICSVLRRSIQTLFASQIKYSNFMVSELPREILDGNIINLLNSEENKIETPDNIAERVQKFNELLLELQKTYRKIAVVSHYGFLYTLCGYTFQNCHHWSYYYPSIGK